ncbi:hypothetical protein HYFRA_00012398 [Hymenoscyphus fraxineus]|uniref:NmrA-like domain-containing protein n=1 Tax=Hymenoscyphus fraxineus TaxID=746836 RepID=A0A9N9L747_9HELO|nr:hypothetical protein HYFRA_00012398 [Hymenoscyphus fraxineus]
MSKTIVILGITGKQGGSVADHFLNLADWKIRGITRNTTSESALALASKGIELIAADFNDPSTIKSAFKGGTAIFVNTNFWEPIYYPGTKALLKEGQSLNEYCYEQELQQLKNIADAAAKVEGWERIVFSGQCNVDKWANGKYKGVYHFDSKARGAEYFKENYPGLAEKMTVLIMGNYMSNWKDGLYFRKTHEGTIKLPVLKGTQHNLRSQVDTRDTGALVHAALTCIPGKTILGAGCRVSWTHQFKKWCEIQNLEYGGFDEVTLEEFEKFAPIPGLMTEIGEMMLFEDEFGYTGGEEILLPENLGVPCQMTSWEDYVMKEDWSRVLATLK